MKGISVLSHVTGTKHDQICHFLFSILADISLPDGFSNTHLLLAI